MAQGVKHFQRKHEDLSLNLRNSHKVACSSMSGISLLLLETGGRDREVPGSLWALAYRVVSNKETLS